jgi:prepilin-type processing-associated H-X9-DG protein
MNNLKQIGLAMYGYHNDNNALPYADIVGDGWNWAPRLLPYLEDSTEFTQINFSKPPSPSNGGPIIQTPHKLFLCPSDPWKTQLLIEENWVGASGMKLAQADYAACIGDYTNSTGSGSGPAFGNVGGTAASNPKRVRGMISRFGWGANFNDVTDGLSNTICVGECIGAMCITQNFGVESFATTAHPINYLNSSLAANLPSPGSNARWDESIGFRSMHPRGANFLFGDGSVHFLRESMDGPTYRGLASISGGENVSAP